MSNYLILVPCLWVGYGNMGISGPGLSKSSGPFEFNIKSVQVGLDIPYKNLFSVEISGGAVNTDIKWYDHYFDITGGTIDTNGTIYSIYGHNTDVLRNYSLSGFSTNLKIRIFFN